MSSKPSAARPLESLEPRRLFAVVLPAFAQTNLVSDQAGVAAHVDPNLVNAWGVVETSAGGVWVSNNGTGTSTIYDSSGNTIESPVTLPGPDGTGTAALTGIALNTTGNFVVSSGTGSGPAEFLFGTEDGTIAAWGPGLNSTQGVIAVNNSAAGAVYKGVTLAGSGKAEELLAANFGQGRVDVFNASFAPVTLKANAFTDPSLPSGFAPFNVRNIGGRNFVTFAQQDAQHQNDVPGSGLGFVDIFSAKGVLLRHFASGGALDAPWGLTPVMGGRFAGDILVGNFGDGAINVFGPGGRFVGAAQDAATGQPLVIPGLWSLTYGAGNDRNTLFFSAGPADETHGLFGTLSIQPVARPAAVPPPPPPPPFPYFMPMM